MTRDYQTGFYNLSHKVRDRESRLKKADKIAYLLTQRTSFPLSGTTCLDVGCSSGIMTAALAPLFGKTFGIDYDEIALKNTGAVTANGLLFLRGDAMRLSFADCSADVIVCAQVYEHVPDDTKLAAEMYRVLKPGGVVFFSGPNRLFPIELHYNLPFIHWLPSRLADACLRLLGRGDRYYERSRTLWGLRRLFAQFAVYDVTIDVLLRYSQTAEIASLTWWMGRVPGFILKLLLPVFPNYNWLLYKPATR